MKQFFAVGILLALAIAFAGCTQDTTTRVDVTVANPSGQPVEGAYVNAYTNYRFGNGIGDQWTNISGSIEATARTDAQGKATLNVFPGQYAFRASKDNASGGTEKLVLLGQNQVTITLNPDTGTLKLTIQDETGQIIDPKVAKLEYTIEYCPGRGNVCNISSQYQPWTAGNPFKQIVPTGNFKLSFRADGYEETKTEFSVYKDQMTEVNVVMKKLSVVPGASRFYEGEQIVNIQGVGKYDGQKNMRILFKRIVATSGEPNVKYSATFELYDESGQLVDARTVKVGDDLKDNFVTSDGQNVIKTSLVINVIAIAPATNKGYVDVTIIQSSVGGGGGGGKKLVKLVDGKGYPYDETNNTGIYDYVATLTASGSNVTGYKIVNSREKWSNSNPLAPTTVGQSLTGKIGKAAVFGGSFVPSTLGEKAYSVEFVGFTEKEPRTTVEIGKVVTGGVTGLDSAAKGGVWFSGADDTKHAIPFALELDDSETGNTFTFDGRTIYYIVEYASSTSEKIKSVTFRKDNSSGTIIGIVTIDGLTVDLTGAGDRNFTYKVFAKKALNRLWLVLAAGKLGQSEGGKIQYGKEVEFVGTRVPPNASGEEAWSVNVQYYVPKDTDFSSEVLYSNPGAYFIANFVVRDMISGGDINVFIDANDGGLLGPFPNSQISAFSNDADFVKNNMVQWRLTSGTQSSYLKAAYTDAGTKVWLPEGDNGVAISMPKNAESVKLAVCEKGYKTMTEGETLSSLKLGATATTPSGIKVTFKGKSGDSYTLTVVQAGESNELTLTSVGQSAVIGSQEVTISKVNADGSIEVEITLGTTFSGGCKYYTMPLSSTAGSAGLELGNNDANLLTKAQLPSLISDSAFRESVGVQADAKFDTSSDIKDLVTYIESNGFFYEAKASNAITKDSCAPLFGKYYEVVDVQATGTKSITFDIAKACAKSLSTSPPAKKSGNGTGSGTTS